MEEFTRLKTLDKYLRSLIENNLWAQVLVALFLGVITGILLGPETAWIQEETSEKLGNWFALPGNIFLKLVQMIMIPLIFSSIILGIVSSTGDQLKKMGVRVGAYYILMTSIAIVIGSGLAMLFKPGQYIYDKGAFEVSNEVNHENISSGSILEDIPAAILELIPSNPLQAILSGEMLSIVVFTILIELPSLN